MSPLPIDCPWGRLPQHVRTPTLTASTPIRRWWGYQCPGCIGRYTPRLIAATRRGRKAYGYSEHREPSPSLGDKSTLHAKGLLLPLVGVEAGVKVEPTTVVLQVMHELMDRDVILRRVGQVLPEENDITVLVQPEDRTWSVVLARPVAEPALRFPLHVGKVIGEWIASSDDCDTANGLIERHIDGSLVTRACILRRAARHRHPL